MSGEGKKYYIDWSQTGGLIHLDNSWRLPDTPLPQSSRAAYEADLSAEFDNTVTFTGKLAKLYTDSKHTSHFIKKRLHNLVLPDPGIIAIGDGYYNGWWLVDVNGETQSVFEGNMPGIKPYRFTGVTSAFRQLDEDYVAKINSLVQRPLTIAQRNEILDHPDEKSHPLYQRLITGDLTNAVLTCEQELDNFWSKAKYLLDDKHTGGLADHLRESALKVAIYTTMISKLYSEHRSFVQSRMFKRGVSVYPISETHSMVTLKRGGGRGLETHVVPLPADKRFVFQRLRGFGEYPMTKEEFSQKYRQHVDPNSSLFLAKSK